MPWSVSGRRVDGTQNVDGMDARVEAGVGVCSTCEVYGLVWNAPMDIRPPGCSGKRRVTMYVLDFVPSLSLPLPLSSLSLDRGLSRYREAADEMVSRGERGTYIGDMM
jgi:hypothetical protein